MKSKPAYEITQIELEHSSEIKDLALAAGYSSCRCMLNELDWWSRDVSDICDELREQIAEMKNSAANK